MIEVFNIKRNMNERCYLYILLLDIDIGVLIYIFRINKKKYSKQYSKQYIGSSRN